MFKYVFSVIMVVFLYFVFFFDVELTNDTIGKLFVAGILVCLVLFLLFKFGLHYKILALNRFAYAFYYSVFEYKKAQAEPSNLTYMDSVREQAEVALAASFDPTLTTADLKIPTTLYSGKDPFLDKLRAKIQQAEKLKLESRKLNRKANVLLGKTKEELVEKELVDKTPAKILERVFEIENGVAAIIDLTVGEIKDQGYDRAPDYDIITRISLDNNPYFSRTFKFFDSEDIAGILFRVPFMIILIGIIGTFAGFYLALNQGGDIKSGASVAIISSLVGLPVSLIMEYINTLFPDESEYLQAFNKYKISLEMLFNHEQELNKEQSDQIVAKLRKENELALAKAEQERVDALAKAEQERVGALARQEAELGTQRQLEVAKTKQELNEQAEREAAKLKTEKEVALAKAEQERIGALAKQEAELGTQRQLEVAKTAQELKEQAAKLEKEKERTLAKLEKAEQERLEALDKQEEELDILRQLEVAKTKQEAKEQAEREAVKLKKEKELALAKLDKAEQKRADALAKQEAELEKQRQKAVAKTEQEVREQAERDAAKLKKEKEFALAAAEEERLDALAKQKAELDKQRRLELAKTEQEFKEQAERDAAKLKKEKERALAEAGQEHQGDLAALKAALEKENAKALSEKEEVFTKKLDQQKKLLAKVAEELNAES